MNNLVNIDGPVIKFITKLVYSVWLNILWFICCIPIITIGPSTTALFYCCQKLVNDEDNCITKQFFHSFRQEFKQSAILGVIFTVVGIAIGIDGYALYHLHNKSSFWTLVSAVFIVAALVYIVILSWIFPLLARYENTILNSLKNAVILAIRFVICTVVMLIVYFVMLLIIVRFFTPAIIFGMGTCAFINSLLLKNVFIMCEHKEEQNEELSEEQNEE